MAEDNLFIHLEEIKQKQYFLKKIKLSNHPELYKHFNDFFNNDKNYFNNKFKNKYILVGKLQENREKDGIISKYKNSKGRFRKYLINSSKVSTSRMLSEDSSHGEKKRLAGGKFAKDSNLKIGQQYIDENQLEDLFNKFKLVKKINKSRTKDFITVKDLIEKKIKIKSDKKLKIDFNDNYNNIQFHKANDNYDYNKTISTCVSNPNFKIEHINDYNSTKNLFTNNNRKSNYSSHNNLYTNNNNNEFIYNQKFMTMNNFYIEGEKKKNNNKKIMKRNKTINRQNQFLVNNKGTNYYNNKTEKKYFSELLANQEFTLLKSSKSQGKLEYISSKISKKINKDKKDLLILNTDSYRVKNELFNKIEKYQKKIGPEHYYNWYQDLRTTSNSNIKEKKNLDYIRNPLSKEINLKIFKNNYSLKNYKKLIKEVNKVSHNCKDMIIKGKDLLQFEYDLAKNLKNKKKLNNFEAYLPTIEIEDKYFAGENKFIKNNENNK